MRTTEYEHEQVKALIKYLKKNKHRIRVEEVTRKANLVANTEYQPQFNKEPYRKMGETIEIKLFEGN